MATFTPGPWHFEPADQGDPSVGIGRTAGFVFADHPDGIDEPIVVCELREPAYRVEPGTANDMDDGIRSIGDEGANGRLIAASPDLLAACEAAEIVLSDLGAELASRPDYMAYFGSQGHGLMVLAMLREALAKARVAGGV